jgi:hypothetical protein
VREGERGRICDGIYTNKCIYSTISLIHLAFILQQRVLCSLTARMSIFFLSLIPRSFLCIFYIRTRREWRYTQNINIHEFIFISFDEKNCFFSCMLCQKWAKKLNIYRGLNIKKMQEKLCRLYFPQHPFPPAALPFLKNVFLVFQRK